MQDDRPPAIVEWITALRKEDPVLAILLEAPVTALFVEAKLTRLFMGEKKEEDREVLRLPTDRPSR